MAKTKKLLSGLSEHYITSMYCVCLILIFRIYLIFDIYESTKSHSTLGEVLAR